MQIKISLAFGKNHAIDPNLSQLNPVQFLTLYIYKAYFNIIITSMPQAPKLPLPFKFYNLNFVPASHLPSPVCRHISTDRDTRNTHRSWGSHCRSDRLALYLAVIQWRFANGIRFDTVFPPHTNNFSLLGSWICIRTRATRNGTSRSPTLSFAAKNSSPSLLITISKKQKCLSWSTNVKRLMQ